MKAYIIIKRSVDALMLCLFVYLMNIHVFGNLAIHAWGGIALFALFVVHNVLNRKYYLSLRQGKYNVRRTVLLVTNIVLLILMILMGVSSCMMSRAVFYNSPFPMSWTGKALHKISTSWGFIVVMVHLSLHAQSALAALEKRLSTRVQKILYMALSILIIAAGAGAFYYSGLWHNMLLIRGHGVLGTPLRAIAGYTLMTMGMCVFVRRVMAFIEKGKHS